MTQVELAAKTLLNQKLISDLESEQPYAVTQFESDRDRFSKLTELIKPEKEPISLFKSSDFPELGCGDKTWVFFTSEAAKGDYVMLFEGLSVAIVVQE